MKDPQQEADELILEYMRIVPASSGTEIQIIAATKCAIKANQNTIDAFEKCMLITSQEVYAYQIQQLKHHNQVRTILKSKLK